MASGAFKRSAQISATRTRPESGETTVKPLAGAVGGDMVGEIGQSPKAVKPGRQKNLESAGCEDQPTSSGSATGSADKGQPLRRAESRFATLVLFVLPGNTEKTAKLDSDALSAGTL
jgi:hypothetical protein